MVMQIKLLVLLLVMLHIAGPTGHQKPVPHQPASEGQPEWHKDLLSDEEQTQVA